MSRTPPNIVIKALLNKDGSPHDLCPIDALRHWLRLSAPWESDAIFINPKSKNAMNSGSVSFYLVKTINAANPNTFPKAHDVRKVSVSLSWTRGISPSELVSNMFWRSSNVFINKYLVPVPNAGPG